MITAVILWAAILAVLIWYGRRQPVRRIGHRPSNNRERLAAWHLAGGPELRDQEHDVLGPLECVRCGRRSTDCICIREHRVYRARLSRGNVVQIRRSK